PRARASPRTPPSRAPAPSARARPRAAAGARSARTPGTGRGRSNARRRAGRPGGGGDSSAAQRARRDQPIPPPLPAPISARFGGVWTGRGTVRAAALDNIPTRWYVMIMARRTTIDPQRGDARSRLLAAGRDVIREKGYAATTVDDLCRHAGVTKGAFF